MAGLDPAVPVTNARGANLIGMPGTRRHDQE